jgi:hypothetical protein
MMDVREVASLVNSMIGALHNGESPVMTDEQWSELWQWAQETQSSLPTEQERAIAALIDAIKVEGPNPAKHRAALRDLQDGWPVLSNAVRRVLRAFKRPVILDLPPWGNSL